MSRSRLRFAIVGAGAWGVHCRISGRAGRATALDRFFDYAKRRGDVWFVRRDEIARHWLAAHPADVT